MTSLRLFALPAAVLFIPACQASEQTQDFTPLANPSNASGTDAAMVLAPMGAGTVPSPAPVSPATPTTPRVDASVNDGGGPLMAIPADAASPSDAATAIDSAITPVVNDAAITSDAAVVSDAAIVSDAAVVSDAAQPRDASPPSTATGTCGGSTPHGCWPPKAGNPMGCPAQIHEQSEYYPPLDEWVACESPYYERCLYLRPDGSEAYCACDLGVHWLCVY